MCAIAGVIGERLPQGAAQAMLQTMHRRGPDDRGIWGKEAAWLLHSRLAVMDPDGGKQPMALSWQGETYILVYNGELYNTAELRQDLEREGHSFIGHSDTEVLLHGYAQWGEAVVEKCNGIFAFAVWEEKKKSLFLARDRIGVKPLFYTRKDGVFLFASEIKTLLAHPSVEAELDGEGAAQILLMSPGRLPGSGVFRGIYEIEPGCCGRYEAGMLTLRRYWYLQDREHRDSFEETAEKVGFLVTDAIRRQMVADVPVGTFLSGGLDSSLISAVGAGMGEGRLKTFSVGYRDQSRYFRSNKFQPESDDSYIRLMADALDTDHTGVILTPEQLEAELENATYARDLPGMGDVDFSLLAFCREIRKDVKVALSGECADEIFGGYPWYRDPEIRSQAGLPWAQNTRQRQMLMSEGLSRVAGGRDLAMDAYLDTCRRSDILPGTSPQETRMKEMVNLNFYHFMQTLLDRKDRMSMYCSLEVRVPFCDYRIAAYLYGVPWEFKDHQGREKGLLRYAMEGVLPEQVLYRKKSPYPKTFDPAYERRMAARLESLLGQKDAPLFALVDREQARGILTEESPWPWYGQLMRRPQTIAWLLQVNAWLAHYQVRLLW